MRLIQIKLKNFRCYKDETCINLGELAVFVGKNDAGKSSIFDALNIFFEGKTAPDKDDACVYGDDIDVQITCVFDNIPSEFVIDSQYATNLADEYLLNAQGNLEITKTYDCTLSKPKISCVHAYAHHPTADRYNDLLALTIVKLKQRASTLDVCMDGVNQTVSAELRRAIWSHADDLQCQETDIELKSVAAKAIWDQLKKHLPVFALFKSDRPSTDQDAEAQDPMKAAIKEAIKKQEDALSSIATKVKDEVQRIANSTVEKISEMAPDLAEKLTPRVTNKNWDTLFSVSLTADDDIPINKRGSGTRRLILLNFFRAKAEQEAEGKETGVIYAIEEPETSQHPHNQVMLIEAFEDLADKPGCQVFLTTHTPTLARRFDQSVLRLVAKESGQPIILYGAEEKTLQKVVESLGVLPDHHIKVFLGIEGRNDIDFLRNISRILHQADEDVPDLGKAEDDGLLVFIPLGGSSLDLWVSRLQGFNRPEFYLMDRDTEPPAQPKYHTIAEQFTARPNCIAWTTARKELENYIHPEVIKSEYPGYSGTGADFEDVPKLFAQATHEASDSERTWVDMLQDTEKLGKKVSRGKKRLNNEFAGKMTPELLSRVDSNDEVRGWLSAIGEVINSGNRGNLT